MYKALVFCVFIGLTLAVNINLRKEFRSFQKQYNKNYEASELPRRYRIFKDNMIRAQELQKANPLASFGVTKFSDLSTEEFAQYYLMPTSVVDNYVAPPVKTDFSVNTFGVTPDKTTWDWFTHGGCTPVYNQGQCGSCWAFSATETIESYFVLTSTAPRGSLTKMSMEQIVDCDTTDHGCNGGMPSSAYQYVQSAGGIDSYASYPYTAGGGQSGTCQFNQQNVVTNVASQQAISGETGLYSQASTAGPVSVCVDASSWQSYQGGILQSCGNNVDHCVQLTGYSSYGGAKSYWVVRNSWGGDWGEKGFIWIAIGKDLCSIGDYATIVADSK